MLKRVTLQHESMPAAAEKVHYYANESVAMNRVVIIIMYVIANDARCSLYYH